MQHGAGRADGGVALRRGRGIGRDVFKLERHGVDATGELSDGVEIVERRHRLPPGHVGQRGVVLGGEDVNPIAESGRGHGEHPAKLTAAEDAERSAGKDGRGGSASIAGHGLCRRMDCKL